MTKRTRILYWVGVVVAPIASFYAFGSFIFYTWMNANGSWSAERAAAWAYPSLALSVIFFGLFVWCVWRLIRKQSNRLTHHSTLTRHGVQVNYYVSD